VYGIKEDKVTRKPTRVDDGVDDPKITREWIEQILNSRAQPRMNGIQTARIDMGNGRFSYVISVPQTQTGPHATLSRWRERFDSARERQQNQLLSYRLPQHVQQLSNIRIWTGTPRLGGCDE